MSTPNTPSFSSGQQKQNNTELQLLFSEIEDFLRAPEPPPLSPVTRPPIPKAMIGNKPAVEAYLAALELEKQVKASTGRGRDTIRPVFKVRALKTGEVTVTVKNVFHLNQALKDLGFWWDPTRQRWHFVRKPNPSGWPDYQRFWRRYSAREESGGR
jgi:hypothetical protein